MELCFASHNKNKLIEIAQMLPKGWQLVGLDDIGINEDIPETGATLEENSRLKADYVFNKKGLAVFADDTGLEVAALNGEPGVYSARYAGAQRSADDNMNLLLQKLKGQSNREACFKTVITFIEADGSVHQFEGRVDGAITAEKKGSLGFGYDPIFKPSGFDKTFAEMNSTEKNAISHRARAFEKFLNYLAAR
jgi:XTP/dITP diphosphohydrolase